MLFWARKYSEKNSKREGFRVYPSIYIIWQGSDFDLSFFVHMHPEHQCSTLVTWSNLKEWCRATHKPPKTMKRLTTYGDVKIWAWFCLVLLAVLLMTLERQHKSCVRGSPHFILGHYDKSVAHCKNDALSLYLYPMRCDLSSSSDYDIWRTIILHWSCKNLRVGHITIRSLQLF